MDREIHRRYPDAAAFADDLDRFLGAEPILARPPTQFERARLWSRRHPAAASTLVGFCLVLAASATYAGIRLSTRLAAARAVERGDAASDRGEFREAILAYNEALETLPGYPEARRRRRHAASDLVERETERLRSGNREEAARAQSFLQRALPDAEPGEARSIAQLEAALIHDLEFRREFDIVLGEAAGFLATDPERALARLEDLDSRLARSGYEDLALDENRARILILAEDIFHGALVDDETDRVQATARFLARMGRHADTKGTIEIIARSRELDGGERPFGPHERLDVRAYALAAGVWSGDQEPALGRVLEGPPSEYPLVLDPGTYLLVVRSQGHHPARFLQSVPLLSRIEIELVLFADGPFPFEICHVPAPRRTLVDLLVPRCVPESGRSALFRRLGETFDVVARSGDFFAARHELTSDVFARIVRAAPRTGWAPLGWDVSDWSCPLGEERLPVRGITQHEARWVAREATLSLLGEDLRERWRFDLPSSQDPLGALGTRNRLGGLSPVACGNQGTGLVAAAGTSPGDVSIHGLADLEGNVSEWTRDDEPDQGTLATGGNFHAHPLAKNEALGLRPEERRDYVGLRLLLVPIDNSAGRAVERNPSTEANHGLRDALAKFRGDPARGIASDPFQAQIVVEKILERDPGNVPARIDAALLALLQQDWPRAVEQATYAIDHGEAPGDLQSLARFARVWALVLADLFAENPGDPRQALGDLDVLIEGRPGDGALVMCRAWFRLLADDWPGAMADLEAILPEVLRLARFERHLGLAELDAAQLASMPKHGFEAFLANRFVELADLSAKQLDGEIIAVDREFLARTVPTGTAHHARVRERWKTMLLAARSKETLDRLVLQIGREGEPPNAVLARVAGTLATLLSIVGLRVESGELLRAALLVGAGRVEPLHAQARIDLLWDDRQNATATYERILALDPTDGAAHGGLAWARLSTALAAPEGERADRLREALASAKTAETSGYPDGALYRAIILDSMGEKIRAGAALEALAHVRPRDPAVQVFLGDFAAREGNPDAAARTWDEAARLDRAYLPLVRHLRATRLR